MSEQVLNIKVDLSGMKIRDLIILDRFNEKTVKMAEVIEFLNRIVIGGVDDYPLTQLGEVMEAVTKAIQEAANPRNPTA